jgi:hypothetical protein
MPRKTSSQPDLEFGEVAATAAFSPAPAPVAASRGSQPSGDIPVKLVIVRWLASLLFGLALGIGGYLLAKQFNNPSVVRVPGGTRLPIEGELDLSRNVAAHRAAGLSRDGREFQDTPSGTSFQPTNNNLHRPSPSSAIQTTPSGYALQGSVNIPAAR